MCAASTSESMFFAAVVFMGLTCAVALWLGAGLGAGRGEGRGERFFRSVERVSCSQLCFVGESYDGLHFRVSLLCLVFYVLRVKGGERGLLPVV